MRQVIRRFLKYLEAEKNAREKSYGVSPLLVLFRGTYTRSAR